MLPSFFTCSPFSQAEGVSLEPEFFQISGSISLVDTCKCNLQWRRDDRFGLENTHH